VLKPAWEEYATGRTPSPCLWCNERVKFGLLAAWAKTIGADAIATGHYARRIDDGAGNPILARATDRNKDQSYFLARLTAAQLQEALFPLGDMIKSDVRAAARRFALPNAEQTESQDTCLVTAGDSFAEALRQRFKGTARPGDIVDRTGKILGHHDGIHRFTIGQRQGLHIASPTRSWVTAIEPTSGTITITNHEYDLITNNLVTTDTCWVGQPPTTWPVASEVQVRYRHAPVPAEIEPLGLGSVRITFQTGVRAITPGQAAVFYRGDRVLGSGWISSSI
jgi:tRNA-specific 2-thiouridylase